MEKIYHLINDEEFPDVIYSSPDRGLLEEIMCDMFMEDCYYQFCWDEDFPYGNRNAAQVARDAWDDNFEYYENYVGISESKLI